MKPPRLVLVHGTRLSRAQWDPYRGLLPELEIVTPDLPGHGSRRDDDFTTPSVLDAISRAVSGADGPVVLAGHSLGGYLASLYAARHPDMVRTLVLIGATADPRGALAVPYRAFAGLVHRVDPARLARVSNAVMRRLGAGSASLSDGTAYRVLPAAWQIVGEECGPHLLRDLTCPVLLVNGQWDQMRLDVRQYAAAARRARVITVRGATHLLPLTHPEQLATILREAVGLTTE